MMVLVRSIAFTLQLLPSQTQCLLLPWHNYVLVRSREEDSCLITDRRVTCSRVDESVKQAITCPR